MVGIGLVAALLVGAMAAGSASAKKSPYNANTWSQYKYCPYEDPGTDGCYAGITSGGPQGGFFKLGNVNVKLSKPVTLQGGFKIAEGGDYVTPATNGGETLESPELKVQGGLSVITKEIQEIAGWPEALKQSFKEAKKNKEATVTAKIEVAGGNQLYETVGALDPLSLILEEGNAFILPLKVKVSNPWLTKLGGGECTIGNEAFPVIQHLTSEGAGKSGHLTFNEDGSNLALTNSTLVDLKWVVPAGGAASGCGGEYEEYVNHALNIALNIGQSTTEKTGVTILQGDLYVAEAAAVKVHAEKGEL